jgi:hypothetical protein
MEPEANDPHALYARLGFIIVSAKMSAVKTKTGEWRKNFAFPRGWQNKETRGVGSYDTRVSGFALVTGAKSGVTAIDIDDPETAQNKRLMELMRDCTLVARTKKGYHYVFKYDARILAAARLRATSSTRATTAGVFSSRRAWRTTTSAAPSRSTNGCACRATTSRWCRYPNRSSSSCARSTA